LVVNNETFFKGKDLDNDAKSVRHFVKQGHELFVAQSFAKNMGLYSKIFYYLSSNKYYQSIFSFDFFYYF
jgi:aspartate/tyrosine/aromatic aminotransferase